MTRTDLVFRIHKFGFDFPNGIREAVLPMPDGYAICIDVKLTEAEKKHEYYYAINQIINKDFIKNDVQKICSVTHKLCCECAIRRKCAID